MRGKERLIAYVLTSVSDEEALYWLELMSIYSRAARKKQRATTSINVEDEDLLLPEEPQDSQDRESQDNERAEESDYQYGAEYPERSEDSGDDVILTVGGRLNPIIRLL